MNYLRKIRGCHIQFIVIGNQHIVTGWHQHRRTGRTLLSARPSKLAMFASNPFQVKFCRKVVAFCNQRVAVPFRVRFDFVPKLTLHACLAFACWHQTVVVNCSQIKTEGHRLGNHFRHRYIHLIAFLI